MNGIITANIVMASSNISIDEAISNDPNNKNIIFSIKNNEILEFSHSYETGTIFGKKTQSLPKIKIEILDSIRIYDPRLIGVKTDRACYFYYGVGSDPKDWAGPILGYLDPMRIVYGTFSSGRRTFILEYWPVVPTYKAVGTLAQKTTNTSFIQIPVFSFSSGGGASPGVATPIGKFHENIEKLFINFAKSIYTADSEVLPLFPDFDQILDKAKSILITAANNSVPSEYAQKKWTSSELQTMYREALQLLGFTVITSQEALTDNIGDKDPSIGDGTVHGTYGGPANRQNLEQAKQKADSSKTVMYISLTKDSSESYEERLKRFFQNITRMYDSPGGPYLGIENNLNFVKSLATINKPNVKISGQKPVVVIGDAKLVFNFLHSGSAKKESSLRNSLNPADNSAYSKGFMKSSIDKNKLDVTNTIFDDKNSKDSSIPIFKIGVGDPNVLDIKMDLNIYLYYALTNIWNNNANVLNSTHNKVGTGNSPLLKSPNTGIPTAMQSVFQKVITFLQSSIEDIFNLPPSTLSSDITKFYSSLQKIISNNPAIPTKNIMSSQTPWFLSTNKQISFASLVGLELQKATYDGTIKTPPFFKFNSPDLMAQGCYLIYEDPVFTANEKGSDLAKVFTGKYYVRAFRHTITPTGAFSEFTLLKMPEGGESPILRNN